MAVGDVYPQNRRLLGAATRGGKRLAMPCHHNPEEYLIAYLDGARPARRSQGAAVPHDRPRHRKVHPHRVAASEPKCDDWLERVSRWHRNGTRKPRRREPGSRSISRTAARSKGRSDGDPRLGTNGTALRSPVRRGEPG